MTRRLSDATRETLPDGVARPAYDRRAVSPGIVHIGLGAFHRAHQAVAIDDCLAAGERDWGIVAASLRSAETRDALAPQDGLYTLSVRDGAAERLRVVGSIGEILVAPEDPARLLAALTRPATRLVTLTVTEKAYLRAGDGSLDIDHADLRADLAQPQRPKTVLGFLARALAERLSAGTPPFTVLSCDNLPENGTTLRRLLVAYAGLVDPALGDRIAADVAFPCCMVDRIVPATTEEDRDRIASALGLEDRWPVTTEPFSQWVVEEAFPLGRPGWERAGVTMVDDVRPFEEMKLRLLNGAHSAIAYLGLLAGHETVAAAFGDVGIRRFVGSLWEQAIPTLPDGLDPYVYTNELTRRFDNTALKHRTAQIATDGSQKLPQRIVAPALAALAKGAPADRLMTVVAAWTAACEARGRSLPAGHFSDPLDARLATIAERGAGAAETVAAVFDAAGFAAGRAERPRLEALAAEALGLLRVRGVAGLLAEGA